MASPPGPPPTVSGSSMKPCGAGGLAAPARPAAFGQRPTGRHRVTGPHLWRVPQNGQSKAFCVILGVLCGDLEGGGGNLPRIFLGSPEQQKKRLVWLCPFVVLVWGLAQSGPEGSDLSVTVSGTDFWWGTRVLSHSITHATIRAKMGTPTPPQAPGCMGRWVRTSPLALNQKNPN